MAKGGFTLGVKFPEREFKQPPRSRTVKFEDPHARVVRVIGQWHGVLSNVSSPREIQAKQRPRWGEGPFAQLELHDPIGS
jgi:hypothetical protein